MQKTLLLFVLLNFMLGSFDLPFGRDSAMSGVILPRVESALRSTKFSQTESRAPLIPTAEPPGGNSMPDLISGDAVIITYIHMIDENSGWGIGHQSETSDHILFTEDGGKSWEDRNPPEPESDSRKTALAFFASDQLAWVIFTPEGEPPPTDDPYIWFTHDGGESWNISQPLATDGLEAFFAPGNFAFIDKDHGWLLVHVDAGMNHDYSYLYATQNGGISWERITDPYGGGIQSLHNTGLAFADPFLGIVSKNNLGLVAGSFFEQTLDGGRTWENVFLPAPPEIDWFEESGLCQTSSPIFSSDQSLSMIVQCRTYEDKSLSFDEWSYTYIYTSTDHTESWHYELLPASVNRLYFLDSQTGWAFGRDFFKTTDGGLSWVPVKSVHWDGQFSFVDEMTGWAVARNGDEIALVFTINGGKTWQIIESEME